ncbi:MAG: prolyl oligopeptidase family serine peptidase [Phycisphaerae bacterium]
MSMMEQFGVAAAGLAVLAAAVISTSFAQDGRKEDSGKAASAPTSALITPTAPAVKVAWADMEKFFAPPDEFKGKLGEYRSVMKFDDGSEVKSPNEWPRRREEILKYWHGVMGRWPAAVEKPKVKYLAKEHVENFTRHKVQVEVAPGKVVGDHYILVPDGKGPFPAVLVTWYGSEDSAGLNPKQQDRVDFGYQLARRGFVTLCIGDVSGQNVREPEAKEGIQPLSFLAYAAGNAARALGNMPEVDPKRIGVVGHSFGGKWSMFASCLNDIFACAVWVDPGIVWNEKDANANYWEKWYLGYQFDKPADQQRREGVVTEKNPRTGAYKKLVAEGHDLIELHALMAPRPFLVSGGAQDRPEHWMALNHTIALCKFLGYENRVAMTMRDGHSPTLESNAQVYAFFEHFLKDAPAK